MNSLFVIYFSIMLGLYWQCFCVFHTNIQNVGDYMLFFAGWAPPQWLGLAGPSSMFNCPSCWGAVLVFLHHCLLRCLPFSWQIQYRITAMVSRCVLHFAPSYLCDLCCPVSVLAARRVLHSAARGDLLVSQACLAIMQ